MALAFAKKGAKASAAKTKTAAKEEADEGEEEDDTPAPKKTSPKTKPAGKAKAGMGWLKKGDAAKNALAEEEAKAALAKEEQGKLWRFWMPEDDERQITFLDGDVDEEGMLDIPMFHEHSVKVNGEWKNFICTQEEEGYCPICDKGDSKPALVGVMTVIDHSEYKVKNGPNAGKIISNTRKLFVAKKGTIRSLSKMAVKRGGLTGCTFDVSREGDKSPGVGSTFDFVEKRDLDEVQEAYGLDAEGVAPADIEEELTYRTAEELVELGVGAAPSGVGHEKGVYDKKKLGSKL